MSPQQKPRVYRLTFCGVEHNSIARYLLRLRDVLCSGENVWRHYKSSLLQPYQEYAFRHTAEVICGPTPRSYHFPPTFIKM